MSYFTKTIYSILFILLLLHPHFITGHIFSLPQAYAQSFITLFIVFIALVVYILHIRDLGKKEDEKKQVENELQISSNKLIDAYKYIGAVNRRLPMLNNVTTNLIKQSKNDKRGKKVIFEGLLATATVSLANASWGMFRFVNIAREHTVREFVHTVGGYVLLKSKVSNWELLQSRMKPLRVVEIGELYVLSTSDREALIQCFFVFPKNENNIDSELSTLQAIVDQAQILYTYMFDKQKT